MPSFAPYASHLVILGISLIVVFNNIEGHQDRSGGKEKEGNSILFAGILKNNNFSIESGEKTEDVPRGIGGFSSQISSTVLGASDPGGPQGSTPEDNLGLATVQGTALIPLAILETEITAGPVEEERKEIVEHIVEAGESVSLIAANYGVSVATILSANNLSETSYIQPGDKLKIPPVSGVLYTVRRGDNLGSIIQTYGGDLSRIMEYNNLGSEDEIQIGQVLLIPGGKMPPPKPLPRKGENLRYFAERELEEEGAGERIASGWIWPTSSRKINQYYSYRHHGVDIDGNIGSPVYAASSGTIVFAGWRAGYGKCIIISHPNGTQTQYAHLSGYKRTGGEVESGELIGYVGNTGWSTGSHLHFEIRTSRGAVNPLNYIR